MMSTTHTRRLTRYQIRAEMQRRRITQEDVAGLARTSQQTVSRVFARRKNIDPATVDRVWTAVEKLFAAYQPVDVKARIESEGAA